LDEDSRALLSVIEAWDVPSLEDASLEQLRARNAANLLTLMAPGEPVAQVEPLRVRVAHGELALRAYRARVGELAPALLYLHGGGWIAGSVDVEDAICRRLANGAACTVLSLEYRLAPEHPFPAPLEDAYAALAWVAANARELELDADRVGVCGQSAGGSLAAALTLLAARRGGPAIAFQALLCPALDASMAQPSWRELGSGYTLEEADLAGAWRRFRGDAPADDPLVSPLLASPTAPLPPTSIVAAECDPLRDEALAYGALLARAGTDVRVRCWPGQLHSFYLYTARLPLAAAALEDVVCELRRGLHGA
jgi:acetyl esterase